MKIVAKIIGIVLLASFLISAFYFVQFKPSSNPQFGLNFSQSYAEYLGFDWRVLYLDMLNDLNPKNLRLMTYWDRIEPERGVYDFQAVAEMLLEAQKRGIGVILAVGLKQPRWPECHYPNWYWELQPEEREEALLEFVSNTVNYYRQFDNIKIWQVENEPLFAFGLNCPKLPPELVAKEIEIVKSLDSRPIILTDSGEQGYWVSTARIGADIFGSTMYRTVYSPRFGYYKYPLPPQYFRLKAGWLKTHTNIDRIIGVELQAEPWLTGHYEAIPMEIQNSLMNPQVFQENVSYARKAGFEQNYLWGVEWWYWQAKRHNDWGIWNEAKQLLNAD